MNSEKQTEEILVSAAPEPQIPNCISFNGTITTDLIKLEDKTYGFILRGINNEEFPLILLKNITNKPDLRKNDKISAFGLLTKYKKDWAIIVDQLFRIPTQEELKNLS